jgi:hypothetical protein
MPQNVRLSFMLDRLPIAVLAGVVGWCLGWAGAWLTDWLQTGDDAPEKLSDPAPRLRSLLIRDPIVQVASALVWAAMPIFLAGDWWRWAASGLLAIPLIQVAVTDFRTRYVYNVVAWIGLALGLAFGLASTASTPLARASPGSITAPQPVASMKPGPSHSYRLPMPMSETTTS